MSWLIPEWLLALALTLFEVIHKPRFRGVCGSSHLT